MLGVRAAVERGRRERGCDGVEWLLVVGDGHCGVEFHELPALFGRWRTLVCIVSWVAW